MNPTDAPSPEALSRKWLAVSLLEYRAGIGFMDRNNGLVCRELNERGIPCRFLALGAPETPKEGHVVLASREELCDPGFWQAQAEDSVLISAWVDLRNQPVLEAIRRAGKTLVLVMDCNGTIVPGGHARDFLLEAYGSKRDQGWLPLPAAAHGLAKTLWKWMDGQRLTRRTAEYLAVPHLCLIESEAARARVRETLRRACPAAPALSRIVWMPRMISSDFAYRGQAKKKRILYVGRLHAFQKNIPALIRALGDVLAQCPDWEAILIGSGKAYAEALLRKELPVALQGRVRILDAAAPSVVREQMESAKIFCLGSRWEGNSIAMAEALSCGCGVVAPIGVKTMPHYIGQRSGTPAESPRARDLCEALLQEVWAWEAGRRDPVQIADAFQGTNTPLRVMARIERRLAEGAAHD